MNDHINYTARRGIASLAAVIIVFGLAILMVVERYNPAVITTVVTGTSLAAAELVRRLQAPAPAPADRDHTPKERS
jgi:hypothetical protein